MPKDLGLLFFRLGALKNETVTCSRLSPLKFSFEGLIDQLKILLFLATLAYLLLLENIQPIFQKLFAYFK